MTTTSSIKQTAGELRDGLMDGLGNAGDAIVDFKQTATRTIGKRLDAIGDVMSKHPMMVAGIALGIGYLIARLAHRR